MSDEDDCNGGEYMQDILESDLLEVGRKGPLGTVHDEAAATSTHSTRGVDAATSRMRACPRTAGCCARSQRRFDWAGAGLQWHHLVRGNHLVAVVPVSLSIEALVLHYVCVFRPPRPT